MSAERDAIEEILRQYTPQLVRQIETEIGAQWRGLVEADDVIQVTCIEAFLHFSQLGEREPASVHRWLQQIARHNLYDAFRGLKSQKRPPPEKRVRAGRLPPGADDESYDGFLEQLAGNGTSASKGGRRAEMRHAIDAALAQLPAAYRDVVVLYHLKGESATEIGESLGISRGAVHMRLARGTHRMRQLLGTASRFLTD